MMSDETISSSPPELTSIFEFQDSRTGQHFGVSLATLLQCLCIAEQRHLVPLFETDWETLTLPPALRALSQLTIEH